MIAPESSYQRSEKYRGISMLTVIDAAREKVPIVDLADLLCGPGKLRRIGAEWVGHCPLPDHEDRTPSFTVNPEKNVWFCHGCVRGGGVVELARLAWGYSGREVSMAAANLLHEFGHEIPPRSASWYRKNERQQATRAGIEQVRKNIKRRRLFRIFILPALDEIGDPAERNEELRRAWSEFEKVPV